MVLCLHVNPNTPVIELEMVNQLYASRVKADTTILIFLQYPINMGGWGGKGARPVLSLWSALQPDWHGGQNLWDLHTH